MARNIQISPYNASHTATIGTGKGYGEQKVVARINAAADLTGAKFNAGDKRFLHVNLEGTIVGPGTLVKNQNDIRGYFLDRVESWIWLQTAGAPANWTTPLAGYVVKDDSPDTPDQSGQITSTISFGVNESAGFFGPVPTGTVSGGITIGASYSHMLTDFTWEKVSDDNVVHHLCFMTGLAGGHSYDLKNSAASLADAWQSPFVGAQLFGLPFLAVSTVPLPIQAIFMNNDNAGLTTKAATLWLAIQAHFNLIEGTNNGIMIDTHQQGYTITWHDGIHVDLTAADG